MSKDIEKIASAISARRFLILLSILCELEKNSGDMANGMDDRRKGLEEEYFHRKNQEAIEKLRAKMKVAEEAKARVRRRCSARAATAV